MGQSTVMFHPSLSALCLQKQVEVIGVTLLNTECRVKTISILKPLPKRLDYAADFRCHRMGEVWWEDTTTQEIYPCMKFHVCLFFV